MAARTYLPTLRRHLHVLDVYIANYSTILADNMTSPQAAAFSDFNAALAALVEELGPEPITD